jgi:hypothetical protein
MLFASAPTSVPNAVLRRLERLKLSPNRIARLLVYAAVVIAAVVIDIRAALGVVDWLIILVVAWVASMYGGRRETIAVALLGSITIMFGLWSSADSLIPLWAGALSRCVAVGLIWVFVKVCADGLKPRRRAPRKLPVLPLGGTA